MTLGEVYVECEHFADYMSRIFGSSEDNGASRSTKRGKATIDEGAAQFLAGKGYAFPRMAVKNRAEVDDDTAEMIAEMSSGG